MDVQEVRYESMEAEIDRQVVIFFDSWLEDILEDLQARLNFLLYKETLARELKVSKPP